MLKQFIAAFLLLLVSAFSAEEAFSADGDAVAQPKIVFNELGVGGGYAWGSLKESDDIEVVPFYIRAGFDISRLVGMKGPNTFQFSFEPFYNRITGPEDGEETGLTMFFRYAVPVGSKTSLFGEIGSGPMYFSLDTVEQGESGFNFLNQFGVGLRQEVGDGIAFSAGYRFRHMSNAGTDTPNRGINSNAFVAGISLLY